MYSDTSPRNPLFSATPGTYTRGSGLRRLLGAVMRNWQRRKMIATFDAMDDWMLSDIGLRREDIVRVVNSFDEMHAPVPTPVLPVSGVVHSGVGANIQRQPSGDTPASDDTRKAA